MVYKSVYHKLCKELLVNIACDGQRISLIWDIEGKLNRAPLLCTPRNFRSLDEAMEYLRDNPGMAQGYTGFIAFEETCLARYNSISVLETYEIEMLDKHIEFCPLCGKRIIESGEGVANE